MGESAICIDRAVRALAIDDVAETGQQDLSGSFESAEIAEAADKTGVDKATVHEVIANYRITPEDFVFLGSAMHAAIEASRHNPGMYNPALEDSNLLSRAA